MTLSPIPISSSASTSRSGVRRRNVRAPIALAALSSLLFSACAAELDDPEAYSVVSSGVGAKGVENPAYFPAGGATTSTGTTSTPTATDSTSTSTPTDPTATPTDTPSTTDTTTTTTTTSTPILSAECADVPTRIFAASCAIATGCHGTADSPPMMYTDLGTNLDGLPARLRDAPNKVGGNCGTRPIVDSADPTASVLLSALSSSPCTTFQMGPLNADDLRCVTEWVQAVAAGEI